MAEKRGQIATEYLLMIAVLLVAVAGIAGYSLVTYNESIALNQVKDSLKDLKEAVNRVYVLGEGNSVIVKIVLPYSVTASRVAGNAVYITATTFGSSGEDFVLTDANVHGGIPASGGIYFIEIRAADGNVSLTQT